MATKVILDVDPGIDDAVALAIALFDPRWDVLAVTATGGNVAPHQATRNVQAIVDWLDPPRLPRLGGAAGDQYLTTDRRELWGPDGLGGIDLPCAELHNTHPSEKVICDLVRAHPEEITIVALGPLTNIARAMQRDPQLPTLLNRLIISGGCVKTPGNVTPCAEFNIHADPHAARTVFRAPTTKTLVPLDVTSQFLLSFDLLDQLPDDDAPAGELVRKMLPYLYRSHRQQLGVEGIYLHDVVTLVAALHPELFSMVEMAGDVETEGEITAGATIFDTREHRVWPTNMDVAMSGDLTAVQDCLLRGIRQAC